MFVLCAPAAASVSGMDMLVVPAPAVAGGVMVSMMLPEAPGGNVTDPARGLTLQPAGADGVAVKVLFVHWALSLLVTAKLYCAGVPGKPLLKEGGEAEKIGKLTVQEELTV